LIISAPFAPVPHDPETGLEFDNKDLPFHSAAVGSDGTICVAWDSDSSPSAGAVKFVKSRDGGRHWSSVLGFAASFTQALPQARTGPMDIFFAGPEPTRHE
jgi:hypothetical protein